jgi:sugar lactone lactonase YvrE
VVDANSQATAQGRIYFDSAFGNIRLDHPEGLAFAHDGSLYCGGEHGEIYKIAPKGQSIELVAQTGGFSLGMAFGPSGHLFVCDAAHKAVYKVDVTTGDFAVFTRGTADRPFRIPNFPVFDLEGYLYVTDSCGFKEPGPGIFRFQPDGAGELWDDRTYNFANGMALSTDNCTLFVVESFSRRVIGVPILTNGSPGERVVVVENIGTVPDGIALDEGGRIYIGCYEPSAIYRFDPANGRLDLIMQDREAHLLCHPTNLAFWKDRLYAANLGRWHITEIDIGVGGARLHDASLT